MWKQGKRNQEYLCFEDKRSCVAEPVLPGVAGDVEGGVLLLGSSSSSGLDFFGEISGDWHPGGKLHFLVDEGVELSSSTLPSSLSTASAAPPSLFLDGVAGLAPFSEV